MNNFIEYKFKAQTPSPTTESDASSSLNRGIECYGFTNLENDATKGRDINFKLFGEIGLEEYKCTEKDEVIAYWSISKPATYSEFLRLKPETYLLSNLLFLLLSDGQIKIIHVSVSSKSQELVHEEIHVIKTSNCVSFIWLQFFKSRQS